MSLSLDLLQRLARGWDKRARVRSSIDLDIQFDKNKNDFLEDLLPFSRHPLYISVPLEMKSKILSCGWLVYNAKTIGIETDIVFPVCMSILNEKFPGVKDFLTKQLITETLVDESYHIHLCTYANEITKRERQIDFQLPSFAFIAAMKRAQDAYAESWQKEIIGLVTAIASEIYITDYLALIHQEKTSHIQPLNSLIVKTHRSDELVHGKIFTHIAHSIFHHLAYQQKIFFAEMMLKPLNWLADLEYELWLSVLNQLGFVHAEKMINDCKNLNLTINTNEGMNDLVQLGHDIGASRYFTNYS